MKTYTSYAIMDDQTTVMTGEVHNTPEEAIEEMTERGYTVEEMRQNGFSLVKILCEDGNWIECLKELDWSDYNEN